MSTVSVLIATRERPAHLDACVETLLAQERLPDEVVVVDQSLVSHLADLEARFARTAVRLRYLHAPALAGLTHARNLAAATAAGALLVFLDDDVVLEPAYLAEIARVFEGDPAGAIGGASGYITNYAATVSWAQRVRSRLFYRGPFGVERDALAFQFHPGADPRPAQRLQGSNMTFRRAVCDALSFDEAYSGYAFGEDRDYSVLVSRRWALRWVPRARLVHHETPRSRLSRERFCELRILSWLRFFEQCVTKTPAARLAYVWLNVGFLTLLAKVWDPATVRGTARGLWRLIGILRRRERLDQALRGWTPEARVAP